LIIIGIVNCKTCSKRLLDVESTILIGYNDQATKISGLYESKDGPAEQPAENLPNADGMGDFDRILFELIVLVYS
jgi:hypothetical protein